MKKVEQFIQEYTRNCNNLLYRDTIEGKNKSVYHPWLTPDQARKVAEIAREETIKEVCEWIETHLNDDYISVDEESVRMGCAYSYLETNFFVEDLKKHFSDK